MEFCNSVPLCKAMFQSGAQALWNMARKKVKDVSNRKKQYQFQVGCMYFPTFENNK